MNSKSFICKRISIIICVFCTLISMISLPVISFDVTTDTVYADDNGNSSDEKDYTTISYEYDGLKSEFTYSDSMLLGNANELSGDLAKVSVALATLAYDEDKIKDCLQSDEMGFTVKAKRVYNYPVNDIENSTYDYNDFVAFMIAHKTITYEGKTYNAYIVPIRGTPVSCEWFSDFNLGKEGDGYHQGFKTAANKVLGSICSEVDTTNNIFLITGHSRGAAVANIVAGELSSNKDLKYLASTDRIFGYTYACPAVKKSGVGKLKNIRNFNNPGDAIAALPLKEWGYERYGEDITLSTDKAVVDNFKQRFKAEKGKEYSGKLHTDSFVATIKTLAADEEAYNSASTRFIIDLLALYLSEFSAGLDEIIQKHADHVFDVAGSVVTGKTRRDLLNNVTKLLVTGSNPEYWDYLRLLDQIDKGIDETGGMSREEFDEWKSNSSLIDDIYEMLEITITNRQDLVTLRNELEDAMDNISYVLTNLEAWKNLFFSSDSGTVIDSIYDAHEPTGGYILWINAMYYGYEGWYNYKGEFNSDIISNETSCIGEYAFCSCTGLTGSPDFTTRLKDLKEIGRSAFYRCTGLTGTLEIPETIENVGLNAFGNCTGLTKLIVPVDYDLSTVFEGCTGIEEIRYTPGKTGVQPSYGGDSNRLEYIVRNTLKTISFDEGITKIGDKVYGQPFSNSDGCKELETVNLPQSLEEVGEYAFSYCAAIEKLKLPANVRKIGAVAFAGCTGLTGSPDFTTRLKNLKEIGDSAFYRCTGLTGTLEIPETIENVGLNAFGNCTGLTKLIVPVDYDLSTVFEGCTGIEEIRYTPGKTGVQPSYRGESNRLEYIVRNTLKTISFDEGITKIGDKVYGQPYSNSNGCKELETVNFPKSLAEVGEYAFYNCLGLSNVYYQSTKADWNRINIAEKNEPLTGATIHYLGEPPETAVEGIALDTKETKITVGDTITLKPVIQPDDATNKAVTWESSDPKIATVDANGNVKGIKPGTVTITVKTQDGDKTAACEVTVKAKTIAVTGVTLDKTNAEITEGESVKLTATVNPSDATENGVTYISSNTDIATVDANGNVKGIKPGTATITVKTQDGGKTAVCEVTVKAKTIAVTGVTLDKTNAEITEGESVKLTATVNPSDATDKGVTFTSSNTGVATVDANGNVKAVKPGTATITVKTKDGGKTAKCTVTVKAKTISPSSIKIEKNIYVMNKGATSTVKATVEPANAENKTVTWSSSNTNVATVDNNGNVTAVKHGTAKITAKTSNGKTAECEVRVNFIDVTTPSSWYYKAVYWAAENGITTGSNGKFNPAADCTREQAITFLWRMAGKPNPKSMVSKFSDVKDKNRYSYKAIMWGSENGLITGSKGKFHPGSACTREQIVTIIWRLAGKPAPKKTNTKFKDVTNPKSYSYKAIMWADEQGIAKGSNGLFRPTTKCKRRDIVTFIYRYKN